VVVKLVNMSSLGLFDLKNLTRSNRVHLRKLCCGLMGKVKVLSVDRIEVLVMDKIEVKSYKQ